MTYTSFAIVGAGADVGIPIVKELLSYNASVVIITRPSSSKEIPAGAKSAAIDYADQAALTATLREHKVQVVLSTVVTTAIETQYVLIAAAKDAGVELYVPSEYGFASAHRTEGFLGIKSKIQEHLRSIDLPYALIYTGIFLEQVPWLVGLDDTGKFIIVGKGDAPVTFTALPDIVGFTAYVLTHLPSSQLHNAAFRLEGARATLNEVAALYGPGTPVVHTDAYPSEYPAHELKTWLLNFIEGGTGITGYNAALGKDEGTGGSTNNLWKDHQWKGLKETLKL